MLQKCLPIRLKNDMDIIYYDGPLLTICRNGDDFYVYFLVDIKLDIDEDVDRDAFILFKFDQSNRASLISDLVKMVNINQIAYKDMLVELLKDRRLTIKYGVAETKETIEWFDIGSYEGAPDTLNYFLTQYGDSFWIGDYNV
jgi:hypothetical protein